MTAYGKYIDFETIRNQKNEKNQYESTTTSTGSTTTARACACARTREESAAKVAYSAFCQVLEYAEDALQIRAGKVMQEDVKNAILAGVSAEVLIACVQEAELAPRPSWGYARAILRRCMASGIKDMDAWNADKAQFARRSARKNPAGSYSQRDYSAEDWSNFFVSFDE